MQEWSTLKIELLKQNYFEIDNQNPILICMFMEFISVKFLWIDLKAYHFYHSIEITFIRSIIDSDKH